MGIEEQVRDALECLAPHFGDRKFSVEDFNYSKYTLIGDVKEDLESAEDRPCKQVFYAGKNVSRHLFFEYMNKAMDASTSLIVELVSLTAAHYGANIYHAKKCNQKHPPLQAEKIALLMRRFVVDTTHAIGTPPGGERLLISVNQGPNLAQLAGALGYLLFERFGDQKLRELIGMDPTPAIEFLKAIASNYVSRN